MLKLAENYDLTVAGYPIVLICDPFTTRYFTEVDIIRQSSTGSSTATT